MSKIYSNLWAVESDDGDGDRCRLHTDDSLGAAVFSSRMAARLFAASERRRGEKVRVVRARVTTYRQDVVTT